MVIVENLSFSYEKSEILKNISIKFCTGNGYGILGENGAGKTTLFNCLVGLLTNYKGHIFLQSGENVRLNSAYLPSSLFFYPNITGMEYLLFHTTISNSSSTNIEHWNKIFNLPLNNFAINYSTGMKKKLAFMAILLQNKKIYVLDEPFNGLDLDSYICMIEIIKKLRSQSKIMIISSHLISALIEICDSISVLHKGGIFKTYSHQQFHEINHDLKNSIIYNKIELINELMN